MSTAALKHTNRLAHESSPYLLQHAHNPVDWYAWGPEAFEAARQQNKPIFLSVGYSTCYWCHVMERQCFENEAIAAEMNQHCINIKVDREERPDVDQLYMNFVQVLTRSGGWPMNVFLTPDLRPFYGGTYFPPEDNHGRPGFPRIVKSVAEAYRDRTEEMQPTINEYVAVLRQMAMPRPAVSTITIDEKWIDKLVDRSTRDFDSHFGGFGSAPKFPRQTLLELLLVDQRLHPNPSRLIMLRETLDALEQGGIRDQLGGGFHRYATDVKWLVPHFEIMLYDNAMLGWIYSEAFAQTGETRYAAAARGIFDFILREMTSTDGAFYTAFDAEVDHQEGLNYLWTTPEIEQLLGAADAGIFNRVYGVDAGPNFADPHHGTGNPDKSILFLPLPMEDISAAMKTTATQLEAKLTPMRQALYAARLKRKQPLLDTKILTSWNALMIRAMAHGGKVLGEPRYLAAAEKAARFLLEHHRQPDGSFYRTSRDGKAKYDAFLDDYAFFARALLDLHAVVGGPWRDEAVTIAKVMGEKFGDNDRGGFYFSAEGAADLIVRQKTSTDSPLPSGNAIAAIVMLELGQPDACRQTLVTFARTLDDQAEGMGSMVEAAARYVAAKGSIEVRPAVSEKAAVAASPQELAAEVVEVQGAWATPTELRIRLVISEPYHLHARDAAKGFIATELRIADQMAKNIAGVDYPPAEELKFPFADTLLRVYGGEAEIVIRFQSVMRSGETIRLALIYQACDDRSCLPAVTKRLEIAVP